MTTLAARLGTPWRAPVFAQLVALVLLALVAALAINVAIVFLLPPPQPDIHPLAEVAEALRAGSQPTRGADRGPMVAHVKSAPAAFPRGHAGFRETILARSLNHARSGDVDDGSDSSRLGVKRVARHVGRGKGRILRPEV